MLANSRDNNFNLLRMLAASAVLLSHAYPLAIGTGAEEPLSRLLHVNLGTLAVFTFFAISGFFITQSFDRRRSSAEFWVARGLRIYPGLAIVLLLTVCALGPAFTRLSVLSYVSDPETYSYLPRNLSLKWLQYGLPGVFQDNPNPSAINGSLWSLCYEVACYGMVALVGGTLLPGKAWRFTAFLGLYLTGYALLKGGTAAYEIRQLHDLSWPFVAGMAFYRFRRLVPLHLGLACILGAASLAAYDGSWFIELFVFFWIYLVFLAASLASRLLRLYNSLGDYSYGMYIYAYPCEQMIAALWHGVSPLALASVAYPVTLVCAVLSWHLVEARALRRRAAVGAWLGGGLAMPSLGLIGRRVVGDGRQ